MWNYVSSFSNEAFKRHTGVSRNVFDLMLWAMHQREDNKIKRGRPSSFSFEEQLLIALEYWPE
jgi:hypothetical protein